MNNQHEPHFDEYARSYGRLHRDSISASGEEPAYFAAYKVDYIVRVLGRNESSDLAILDFGCGIGNSLPHLAGAFPGAKLHGVDVSSESISLAQQRCPQAELHVVVNDCMPIAESSIDIAMAACVYHHIPPEQRQAWTNEIRRVLKPDGHFFIFEHNPINPLTQWVVKNCAFDDDAILLPTRESLGLLDQAGMRDASIDYIVFFPKFAARLRALEKRLGWLPLGAQYVAHARA